MPAQAASQAVVVAAAPVPVHIARDADPAEKLAQLKSLLEKELITQADDYEEKKAQILAARGQNKKTLSLSRACSASWSGCWLREVPRSTRRAEAGQKSGLRTSVFSRIVPGCRRHTATETGLTSMKRLKLDVSDLTEGKPYWMAATRATLAR